MFRRHCVGEEKLDLGVAVKHWYLLNMKDCRTFVIGVGSLHMGIVTMESGCEARDLYPKEISNMGRGCEVV